MQDAAGTTYVHPDSVGGFGLQPSARIGPNAIIRTGEALDARLGSDTRAHVFAAAGLAHYLDAWPETMVNEGEVAALYRALHASLPAETFAAVAGDAGRRTGDYLLAHRVPRPVQALLKPLPARPAAAILLNAIARHAWTFAGSGRFTARPISGGVELAIAGCPLCRGLEAEAPLCQYYAATFGRLFQSLVSEHATVGETACQAAGAPACVFALSWRHARNSR